MDPSMQRILKAAAGRLRWRRMLAGAVRFAIVGAIACVSLELAWALTGSLGWREFTTRLLPWGFFTLIVLAAGIGAVAASKRVSLLEAAIFLDGRWDLRERLAMAVELLDSDSAMSRLLCRQTQDALRGREVGRVDFGGPSRRAAGALGLLVILCGAMLFWPSVGVSADVALLAELVDGAEMTSWQRMELSRRLEQLAVESREPQSAAELSCCAAEMKSDDPELTARSLRNLEQMVREGRVRLVKFSSPADGEKLRDDVGPNRLASSRPGEKAVATGGPSVPSLWIAPCAAGTTSQANGGNAISLALPDDAWREACRRANESAAREVPPAYRQRVKDYFLAR